MKASVIICTFNRVGLLRDSLLAVLKQDFSANQYQVIVVDNNSSDGTRAVVAELARNAAVELNYVFEARQGLSFARNAGISSARGDIIVFTDDDIDAGKSWLRELMAGFNAPDVACAGGPIRPVWPCEKPAWITSEWEGFLSVSEFEAVRESGEFSWPHYPWGANIAFRREVFRDGGMFPVDLGRVGTSLLSNEEISVCRQIEKSGKRIRFAPEAVIHHKIPAERLAKRWFYRRMYYQGRSDAILDEGDSPARNRRLRNYSAHLSMNRDRDETGSFSAKCYDRRAFGYLYQALFMSGSGEGENAFKRLRALKTLISAVRCQQNEIMRRSSLGWKMKNALSRFFGGLK